MMTVMQQQTKLEMLNLSGNKGSNSDSNSATVSPGGNNDRILSKIPQLSQFTSLKILSLSNNLIAKIEGLECLQHTLRDLNLSYNKIRKIENLSLLHQLISVNLSGNNIIRIPDSMSMLKKLEILKLARNDIEVVGDIKNLSSLSCLYHLTIEGNPISVHDNVVTYTINTIKSLQYLDDYEVNYNDRVCSISSIGNAGNTHSDGSSSSSFNTMASDVDNTPESLALSLNSTKTSLRQELDRSEAIDREIAITQREYNTVVSRQNNSNSSKIEVEELLSLLEEKKKLSIQSKRHIAELKDTLSNGLAYHSNTVTPFSSATKSMQGQNRMSSISPAATADRTSMQATPLSSSSSVSLSSDARKVIELTEKIDRLSSIFSQTMMEKEALENEVQQSKQSNSNSSTTIGMSSSNKMMATMFNTLQKELEDSKKKLVDANAQVASLKATLQSVEASGAMTATSLQKEVDEERRHNKEIFQQLEDKFQECDRLKGELRVRNITGIPSIHNSYASTASGTNVSGSGVDTISHQQSTICLKNEKAMVESDLDAALCQITAVNERNLSLCEEVEVLKAKLEASQLSYEDVHSKYLLLSSATTDDDTNTIAVATAAAAATSSTTRSRQKEIDTLSVYYNDMRRNFEDSMHQLDINNKHLAAVRDDISKSDSELSLTKRLLESSRQELKEIIHANDIEHKNNKVSKQRNEMLHDDIIKQQEILYKAREMLLNEENKIKSCKSVASEQLRLIQEDFNRVKNDFKCKQKEMDELHKQYQYIEEEGNNKQKQLCNELHTLQRHIDEENKRLQGVKAEYRTIRIDVDNIQYKRKQYDSELTALADAHAQQVRISEEHELETRKKSQEYSRIIEELDRNAHVHKERIVTLTNEYSMLKTDIDGMKRHQTEYEKSIESRRRSVDDEVAAAQSQLHEALKTSRHVDGQIDVKKSKLEDIHSDIRIADRRIDECKRSIREYESTIHTLKESLVSIESDKESVIKDVYVYKQDEMLLKHHLQSIKHAIDNDTKCMEDTKRRLKHLVDEENVLKDSENRLKVSLLSLKKTIDTVTAEIDDARSHADRERRVLNDMKVKRDMMECDISRLTDSHKFTVDSIASDAKRKQDMEVSIGKVKDEYMRLQRDYNSIKSKINECMSDEKDYQQRQVEARETLERYRLDIEQCACTSNDMHKKIERLETEAKSLTSEMKQMRVDINELQQERIVLYTELEKIKSSCAYMGEVKDNLTLEIDKLRETNRAELVRTEKIEDMYYSTEKRIKEIRVELNENEESLQRLKDANREEERKIVDQKKLLKITMDELVKIEDEIGNSNMQLVTERSKAIGEISALNSAKSHAKHQLFVMSESHRRLESKENGSIGNSVSSSIDSSKLGNEAIDYRSAYSNSVDSAAAATTTTTTTNYINDSKNDLSLNNLNANIERLKTQASSVFSANIQRAL